jgi:hypothetical protein
MSSAVCSCAVFQQRGLRRSRILSDPEIPVYFWKRCHEHPIEIVSVRRCLVVSAHISFVCSFCTNIFRTSSSATEFSNFSVPCHASCPVFSLLQEHFSRESHFQTGLDRSTLRLVDPESQFKERHLIRGEFLGWIGISDSDGRRILQYYSRYTSCAFLPLKAKILGGGKFSCFFSSFDTSCCTICNSSFWKPFHHESFAEVHRLAEAVLRAMLFLELQWSRNYFWFADVPLFRSAWSVFRQHEYSQNMFFISFQHVLDSLSSTSSTCSLVFICHCFKTNSYVKLEPY